MPNNRKLKQLEKTIQQTFDNFNWYGYNEKQQKKADAAQDQYRQLTGSNFKPQYNCPA
jgi:hypothetical protein